MNIIKLLPTHEAQKIAAGEVIGRPANVVKELLENSLDAGARTIAIDIAQAGKKQIRIIDDGSGMSPEDALLCFSPHATSKITSVDELSTIDTFGFRGEALASIAAISKVTLRTKTKVCADSSGTQVTIAGGTPPQKTPIACNVGCDIIIEDLFFNTLPRRKFLKRDETEWHQIVSVVQAFCLSNCQVSFKLMRDGMTSLHAPAVQTLPERLVQLWGHNTAQNFIALTPLTQEAGQAVGVSGVLSMPHYWRYNRNQQFFFVNGRCVKNSILGKGLLAGYQNVLPPQKYPGAVLNISIDKTQIDVNVHPQKDEVHFSAPGRLQKAITEQVIATLEAYTNKTIVGSPQTTLALDVPSTATPPIDSLPQKGIAASCKQTPQHTLPPRFTANIESLPQTSLANPPLDSVMHTQHRMLEQVPPKIIGQLFTTYIMLEHEDSLVLVDQHAAHERILYERFASRFAEQDGLALLFPVTVTIAQEHIEPVIALSDLFAQHGITINQSGPSTVSITTAPPESTNVSFQELITHVVTLLESERKTDSTHIRKQIREHVHSHLACKSAIKAGDLLDEKRMRQIIDELAQTKNRYICAHGRPTSWTVRKDFIEKQFKRRL